MDHAVVRVIARGWSGLRPLMRVFVVVSLIALPLNAFLNRQVTEQHPAIKGLPRAPRSITLAYLDPQAINARLQAVQRAEFTPLVHCRRLGLVALNLVTGLDPPISLAPTGWIDRFAPGRSVQGFYVPGSDTLFMPANVPGAAAHEMVHAYEDQVGTRLRSGGAARTTDESIALRAAIEGTAAMVTEGQPILAPFSGDLDHNALVLAYGVGPAYVTQASAGDPGRAISLHPSSTASVLFPTMEFPAPDSAWSPVVLAADEHAICTDRLGAIGLVTALDAANAPLDDAQSAASGWRGDRVTVVEGPSGVRAVWDISFADSQSAAIWTRGPGAPAPGRPAHATYRVFVSRAPVRAPSPLDALGR